MGQHLISALTALRLLGVLLAGILVYQAVRGWRRSGETRMFRLTVGFSLLLASLLIEGLVFQLGAGLEIAHITEAATQVAALSVFVWALY